MTKPIIILRRIITSKSLFSEDTAAPVKSLWSNTIGHTLFPLYAVSFFVLVVLILVMVVAFYMLRILNFFIRQGEEAKARELGIIYKPTPSLWNLFWNRINATVPLEKESSIELDHNYDGIKELDN